VFTHEAGQLRYVTTTGQTQVQVDANGDGMADAFVTLTGEFALTGSDFIL
jgi:hypothetical protein